MYMQSIYMEVSSATSEQQWAGKQVYELIGPMQCLLLSQQKYIFKANIHLEAQAKFIDMTFHW